MIGPILLLIASLVLAWWGVGAFWLPFHASTLRNAGYDFDSSYSRAFGAIALWPIFIPVIREAKQCGHNDERMHPSGIIICGDCGAVFDGQWRQGGTP